MSPKGEPLTDEQYAAIAWADPDERTAGLARRLGLNLVTVSAMRSRLAHAGGWWCELAVVTCAECGNPVLTNPQGAARRAWHTACQQRHREQVTAAYARRLVLRRQEERLAREARRVREHVEPQPLETFRERERWSAEEDARLLAEPAVSAPDLARELGRSPASISTRRMRLRRRST